MPAVGDNAGSVAAAEHINWSMENVIGSRLDRLETALARLVNVAQRYIPEIAAKADPVLVMQDGTVAAKLAPRIDRNLADIYSKRRRTQ